MAYEVCRLDSVERAREKQASRERDVCDLNSGQVSAGEISHRNDFFAALDVQHFSISCIGYKKVSA